MRPLYRRSTRATLPADLSEPTEAVLHYLEDCGCRMAARLAHHHRTDLEDTTQTVLVGLYAALATFDRTKGKFGPYATGAMHYAWVEWRRTNDHLTRSHRAKLRGSEVRPELRSALSLDELALRRKEIPGSPDPAETVIEAELQRQVVRALGRLPAREAAAVRMHFLEERTFQDVGDTLAISQSRAFQLAQRGVSRLRTYLNG